jgi:hypothetical protein
LKQREIGELIGVDDSSGSVGRKRVGDEAKKERALGKKLQRFEGSFFKNKDLTLILLIWTSLSLNNEFSFLCSGCITSLLAI